MLPPAQERRAEGSDGGASRHGDLAGSRRVGGRAACRSFLDSEPLSLFTRDARFIHDWPFFFACGGSDGLRVAGGDRFCHPRAGLCGAAHSAITADLTREASLPLTFPSPLKRPGVVRVLVKTLNDCVRAFFPSFSTLFPPLLLPKPGHLSNCSPPSL